MRTLEKNVKNTWGHKGKVWLSNLPDTLKILAKEWSLTNIKPVALKISCDKELIDNEHKALVHFNGKGVINALARNQQHNALLIQQAIPGNLLIERTRYDTSNVIEDYANVVSSIRDISLNDNRFPQASQWCDAIDRINDSRIDSHLINKAKTLSNYLVNTAKEKHLCHGDLHLENIIQHGEQWLAIDPKGVIGEAAFEAAAFDFINLSDYQRIDLIAEKLSIQSHQLATALNINVDRLISWIFLRAIISAQWFIEDGGDPSHRLILANQIYPMLRK